jgi:hypothetical protein
VSVSCAPSPDSLFPVGSNAVVVTFAAPTVMKALRIDQKGIKDKWWPIHALTGRSCVAQ